MDPVEPSAAFKRRGICLSRPVFKKSTIPTDYIAIVGDSHAAGSGDWLMGANRYRNPPYYSGHVINSLTGRDVVSFGRGSTGSVRGLVLFPWLHFKVVKDASFYHLDQPKAVFVYFYEGNDLNDNLKFLKKVLLKKHSKDELFDEKLFSRFIVDFSRGSVKISQNWFLRNLFF